MDIIKEIDDLKDDLEELEREHRMQLKVANDRIDNLSNFIKRLLDEVLVEKSIKEQLKEELRYL